MDNPKFNDITVSPSDEFKVNKEQILEGVYSISNEKLKAIPYYSWANRGVGKMKVWLPLNKDK